VDRVVNQTKYRNEVRGDLIEERLFNPVSYSMMT
jgi:hypothetical protein